MLALMAAVAEGDVWFRNSWHTRRQRHTLRLGMQKKHKVVFVTLVHEGLIARLRNVHLAPTCYWAKAIPLAEIAVAVVSVITVLVFANVSWVTLAQDVRVKLCFHRLTVVILL